LQQIRLEDDRRLRGDASDPKVSVSEMFGAFEDPDNIERAARYVQDIGIENGKSHFVLQPS
jgi:hypothetical protein